MLLDPRISIVALGIFVACSKLAIGDLFDNEIVPILQEYCARCHSGDEPQGELDLTTQVGAFSPTHGDLIVPGNASRSRLIEIVSGTKPEMPKKGTPLSPSQVESLRKWIDSGADWPDGKVLKSDPLQWWSLQPLVEPQLPNVSVEDSKWIRNPIDQFVIAKLRELHLAPSAQSDRRTYIRRVFYDLTGLPPTLAEVRQFENDSSPNAFETLVDRLLESPRYGERWAQHWLDVAHYGDTHGYDKDKVRPNAWPYRDYVIRSFNQDKPYSQFVKEQLAGDHFYPDTLDGITGLGFLAAGPFDFVGQIEVADGTLEKKRVRNIDRDDMVSVAMNTFVSQTAQCARCHNHKFDPITQEDYYSLQAVFAAIDRADRPYDADPRVASERSGLNALLNRSKAQSVALQAKIKQLGGKELEQLDQQIANARVQAGQATRPEFGYHSAIESNADTIKWVQIDLGKSQPISSVRLIGAYDDFAGIGAGFGFPVRFKIESSDDADFALATILVDNTQRDVPNPGIRPIRFDAKNSTARYIRVTATKLAPRQNDFIFALAELTIMSPEGANLSVGANVAALDSIEAPVRWAKANLIDGISPANVSNENDRTLDELQDRRENLLQQVMDDSTRLEWKEVENTIATTSAKLKELPVQQQVYAAAGEFPPQGNFTSTQGRPRPIFLLDRGSENSPRQEVGPGTIACLPDLKARFAAGPLESESARRAALANWIVDSKNALTWRSIANRVWAYHFGRGIVETTNDFGRMGAIPSHPELLDYLATEFRDGKQSIKDLHRLIVLSATYRQAASHRDDYASVDSENRYYWRMNRRRLEAEAMRDTILWISGKLRMEMGGPSFRPFRFEDDHSPRYLYEEFDPDDTVSHRRSIYRMIVRSVPDPWMASLDCADPSISVDRRNETLTALQSLSMLNNAFVIRMSEHFAQRISEEKTSVSNQVVALYQNLLQREPTAEELAALVPIAMQHGLANVCRVMFNSNEFVFVD